MCRCRRTARNRRIFVAEIKTIFEHWQLSQYLETARETEPFDDDDKTDPEEVEDMRKNDIRQCTRDLLRTAMIHLYFRSIFTTIPDVDPAEIYDTLTNQSSCLGGQSARFSFFTTRD